MNARERLFLHDVQAEPDPRNLRIGAVGVKGLRYPVAVMAGSGVARTIATFTRTLSLPSAHKGTHMSRFVELLEALDEPLDSERFTRLVAEMLKRLDALSGSIEMRLVVVPATSLCPCSKGIPRYGAHNQRSAESIHNHSAFAGIDGR